MASNNKLELVELITKESAAEYGGWAILAQEGKVRVEMGDMEKIYKEVLEFEENRKSYSKQSFEYYLPAIKSIELAYKSNDFQAFKDGCDNLLGKLGDD